VSRPTALVLAAAGTNRDHDVAFALDLAGAEPRITLLSELIERPSLLSDGQMVVIAGGFSYADALGAGRMFALQLEHRVGDVLRAFVAAKKPVIGICNGFQVLTRTGLLPGALGHNASGHFQCQWVTLETSASRCIWTRGVTTIDCPIAHGEGRYTHTDSGALAAAGQIALRYAGGNPNGSVDDIAGVCDPSGVVLGLMPHPENHVITRQFPGFTHGAHGALGLTLFEQGVRYAKEL
jgi:phosphoribosylformylglycinamidine synthase subunit PurQ / glutaminase